MDAVEFLSGLSESTTASDPRFQADVAEQLSAQPFAASKCRLMDLFTSKAEGFTKPSLRALLFLLDLAASSPPVTNSNHVSQFKATTALSARTSFLGCISAGIFCRKAPGSSNHRTLKGLPSQAGMFRAGACQQQPLFAAVTKLPARADQHGPAAVLVGPTKSCGLAVLEVRCLSFSARCFQLNAFPGIGLTSDNDKCTVTGPTSQ